MKRSIMHLLSVPLATLVFMGFTRTAIGEEMAASKKTVIKDETVSAGPSRTLLQSGIWTLGLSYVPAVVVAAESTRQADKRLYVPVAGPWLDLAARDHCPANTTCDHETTNKVLLVVDGIFQGIGAINILGAFLFPETRTVTVSSSTHSMTRVSALSLHVIPTQVGGSAYGLAALGTF